MERTNLLLMAKGHSGKWEAQGNYLLLLSGFQAVSKTKKKVESGKESRDQQGKTVSESLPHLLGEND